MTKLEREIAHLKGLQAKHHENIRTLEEQKANYGMAPPLPLLNALKYEQEQLHIVEERLAKLTAQAEKVPEALDEPLRPQPFNWEGVGAIVGVIGVLIALGAWLVPNAADFLSARLSVTPTTTPTRTPTTTATGTPTSLTDTPTVTPTNSPTYTPVISTATPTDTPSTHVTPTLTLVPPPLMPEPVAGATIVWDKDSSVMVYVPAGEFIMGSDEGDSDEQPVHTVYLDAFYIDKYEVTNAQYRACVEAGACSQPHNTDWYKDPALAMHPVVHVDWNQVNDYCQWLGKRLPTEAQWEKAARGTDGWTWPWGDSFDAEKVNSWESGGTTTPMDWYANGASVFGVLNMAGNVAEWTADWYGSDYYHSASVSNPQGPASGRLRVARGGSWLWNQYGVRTADRNNFSPDTNSHDLGFRCAKSSP